MKNILKIFLRDGNTTILGAVLLVALGFGLAYLSLEYFASRLLKVLGLSIGLAIAAVGGFSGRADSLGLKPFTSDPLGWRKAKDSYKPDVEEKDLKK